jgi:hypothetical protein
MKGDETLLSKFVHQIFRYAVPGKIIVTIFYKYPGALHHNNGFKSYMELQSSKIFVDMHFKTEPRCRAPEYNK